MIVHSSVKVSVDLNDPGVPAPGTVKEGYDENLDKPRPQCLDEYLEFVLCLFKYDLYSSTLGTTRLFS